MRSVFLGGMDSAWLGPGGTGPSGEGRGFVETLRLPRGLRRLDILVVMKKWGFLLASGLLFLSGCQSTGMDAGDYVRARFVLEASVEGDFSAMVTLPLSQVRIPVKGDAILSEFDYRSIEIAEVALGKCLLFSLKGPAAREFYQISVANQGKRLVLAINGEAIGARRIDGPIADGRIFMFLEATDERLEEIASKLQETNFDIQKKLSR